MGVDIELSNKLGAQGHHDHEVYDVIELNSGQGE